MRFYTIILAAAMAAHATGADVDRRAAPHFVNEVQPILTRLGCNSGSCHGKADGQNGFKLSLLGFEPEEDYEYIVKEHRGRRVTPTAAENSLLLRKPTGQLPHGGGKRLDLNSDYYRTLRLWIEAGCPEQPAGDSSIERIEVLPEQRVLAREQTQQLRVMAYYHNGRAIEVTHLAQFESNRKKIAQVSDSGLITAQGMGVAAIMVRYQAHVAAARITVPLGAPVQTPGANSFIDERVFAKLRELGVPPSAVCDDGTFIRRVTIDIAGRLPELHETVAFLKDRKADKRTRLIERLLDSEDHAEYFANKWGPILHNRRKSSSDDPKPTRAFHDWLRDGFKSNKRYDQLVRDILTVEGEEIKDPPVTWYRELKEPSVRMEEAAQLFLGQRLNCAKCHHHPLERWSQHDYWSFTALFNNVVVKDALSAITLNDKELIPATPARVLLKKGPSSIIDPRTNRAIGGAFLGGETVNTGPDADVRRQLVDWICANPDFARTLVNRYWKHFLGTGLFEPEDDLRATNPASNPELLDALARQFIADKFDLKKLIARICDSSVYQLSAVPNGGNAADEQNYSRFVPRRLNAEVMLDAIDQVTATPTGFQSTRNGRAVQFPDNLIDSYFLSIFGRPDASSACECQRSSDATLAQSLHLFNSPEILAKISGRRAQQMAKDTRPHAERIAELYLIALSRNPTASECEKVLGYIQARHGTEQSFYEDIIWALLNSKEFLFNH